MSAKWITQSSEKLTHFKHEGCGWWSVSEAPERATWFCPYCGKELELAPPEVALVGNREPTQAEIEYGKMVAAKRIVEIERNVQYLSERYSNPKLDQLLKPLIEEKSVLLRGCTR